MLGPGDISVTFVLEQMISLIECSSGSELQKLQCQARLQRSRQSDPIMIAQ